MCVLQYIVYTVYTSRQCNGDMFKQFCRKAFTYVYFSSTIVHYIEKKLLNKRYGYSNM